MDVTVGEDTLPLREYAKREKLDRIQAAAQRLLAERTMADFTMRDVARAARVGEATLFRYVGTKEQLLLLVFEGRMEEQLRAIENAADLHPQDDWTGFQHVDAVCRLYRYRSQMYVEDPANVTDYVRAALVPGSVVGGLSVSHGDRTRRVVEQIIRHGQDGRGLADRWPAKVIAENCAGTYIHEIVRSPVRDFGPETFVERLETRLRAQLEPLIVPT